MQRNQVQVHPIWSGQSPSWHCRGAAPSSAEWCCHSLQSSPPCTCAPVWAAAACRCAGHWRGPSLSADYAASSSASSSRSEAASPRNPHSEAASSFVVFAVISLQNWAATETRFDCKCASDLHRDRAETGYLHRNPRRHHFQYESLRSVLQSQPPHRPQCGQFDHFDVE